MRKRLKWTQEMINTALEMLDAGGNWTAIAAHFGCSVWAVKARLTQDGIGYRWSGRNAAVSVSAETWDSLLESAKARGKGVGELLSDVAAMLADPVLLENVLDDGVSI